MEGLVRVERSKALSKREGEEGFAFTTQLQIHSSALQVKGLAARLGLLSAHPPANSVMLGVEHN